MLRLSRRAHHHDRVPVPTTPRTTHTSRSQSITKATSHVFCPIQYKPVRHYSSELRSELEGRFAVRRSDKDLHALGGYEEEFDQIANLVKYLQNPDEYTKDGIKAPKGVVLSGPPGVGKTFLANAIAGHAGVNLIVVSAAELESPYVGVSERLIRELFKQAKESAPCLVCIDELDSIASKRISVAGASPETQARSRSINSNVNQLLSSLSEDNPGVVVVGTTNLFEDLDPAIVRPGRFDKHIRLGLPTDSDRKRILELFLKDKKLQSNTSIDELVALSAGFSGSKLAGWVNEAAVLASKQKNNALEAQHFDVARDLLERGVTKKIENMAPEQKLRIATHESGHAVVGHLLNQKVYKVTINSVGNSLGHTEFIPNEKIYVKSKDELLDAVCTALAGRAANSVFDVPVEGFESDLEKAKELARQIIFKEGMGSSITGIGVEVEVLLQEQMKRAITLLHENKNKFINTRDILIELGTLYREDFHKIMEGKQIAGIIQKWFGFSKTMTEAKITLPASRVKTQNSTAPVSKKVVKETKVEKQDDGVEERQNDLPVAIQDIEKALNIPKNSIRSVENYGNSYEIHFVPSLRFNKDISLIQIAQMLRKSDVDCNPFESLNELDIKHRGVKDFIKFVRLRCDS